MSKMTLAADTLKFLGASADILNNTVLKGGAKIALNVKDLKNVGGSITQLSGQSQIVSRLFVEEAVLDEPVYPYLVKHCFDWYAAQIMAALNISKLITSKHTVQQLLSVVQDGRNNRVSGLTDSLLKEVAGVESFLSNLKGEVAVEALGAKNGPHLMDVKTASQLAQRNQELEEQNRALKEPFKDASFSMRPVKVSENKSAPMGELFEVTITNPQDKNLSVKVPIFVQMMPRVIPTLVAPRFIDINVVPDLWQRWTQWKAGEISFWNDFLWKRDLMKRKMAVVKDPEAAQAMTDFLRTITTKDRYALGDVGYGRKNTRSANLANSVIFLTEETLARAMADSAIDLHNEATRKDYFNNTYTMILAVLDTNHQRVTIYFNGIDGSLNLSYNEFKSAPKSETAEFMNALTAFSTNNIGRLR